MDFLCFLFGQTFTRHIERLAERKKERWMVWFGMERWKALVIKALVCTTILTLAFVYSVLRWGWHFLVSFGVGTWAGWAWPWTWFGKWDQEMRKLFVGGWFMAEIGCKGCDDRLGRTWVGFVQDSRFEAEKGLFIEGGVLNNFY
jgi:hypothetical protein